MFSKRLFASTACLLALAGPAQADLVVSNFNAHGYEVLSLNIAVNSTVDITYLSGYGDATFSLFDSSGNHLISNDDSAGLDPHLTQNLVTGSYSLLVSFCCQFAATLPGATFPGTDGFNFGSYWLGGSGTLSGMMADLDGILQQFGVAGAPYSLSITNASIAANVPEPSSFGLAGLALLSLAMRRKGRLLRS